MYNKRLDDVSSDQTLDERLHQTHLAYIPDLHITIGSHLSPVWKGTFWDITLFLDERSDKTLDRVYQFRMFIVSAASLFYSDLPEIIVAARSERDPLSYLYGCFSRFGDKVQKEPTDEHRAAYAAMLSELERQMCVPSGW